jgi:CBS domain containing-hemolysin-like protein
MSNSTLLTLLVIFLLLSALFSGTETALFAMPRARLRRLAGQGGILSDVFRQVLEVPHRILVGILLGNTLASVAATAVGVILLSRLLEAQLPPYGILIIQMLAMSFILLVFCEMGPKTHALEHRENASRQMAFFYRMVSPLLRPFAAGLEGIAHGATRLFAGGSRGGVSVEDLQLLIEEGEQKGSLTPEEGRLFSGAFHLRQLSTADVMTHRADLVTAPVESTTDELIELVNASGRARIPVYERTIDHIVGIIESGDLLPYALEPDSGGTARDVMRPPHLVPPSRSLEELLLNMQRQRLQIVVVARPEGETLGIVTLEDIVEVVVGDIQSEFEEEEAAVRLLEDGAAIVHANVQVTDVNRLLGTSLASDNGGTVESVVRLLWTESPSEGEERTTPGGDSLRIESMVGPRVWSVRVHRERKEGGR